MKKTVLVVGATGMAGRYFLQYAEHQRPDWDLIGLARRPLDFDSRATYVAADLNEDEIPEQVSRALTHVTDLVFAGFVPAPTWLEQVDPNRRLLANALAAVKASGAPLQRVILIQGMKYYGSHLGAFPTPAREDAARHMPPNYYYAQQDLLEQAQQGQAWHWTCLRPHVIAGYGARSPQNLLTVLGVYAAISRHLGLPLCFPGTAGAYRAINQATDARILAQAIAWALDEPACRNEAFNITNGDFFRWEHLWPAVAHHFQMPYGAVQTLDLGTQMADKADIWAQICEQHQLESQPFDELVNWPFADYIWRCDWDVMASTIKARQAGFAPCIDTQAMYLELLGLLQDKKVLPR
ncbi:MAG: SDR family oxidoreductase [Burkholderiaceae bacterium]